MNIHSTVKTALADVGVPVSFLIYQGSEPTYITFFEYNQFSAWNADDEEQITAFFIQIDVWSKENYNSLVDLVKTKMNSAGFRRTSEVDLYESDTKIFHKVLRFRLN